jgi:hypothetical protein
MRSSTQATRCKDLSPSSTPGHVILAPIPLVNNKISRSSEAFRVCPVTGSNGPLVKANRAKGCEDDGVMDMAIKGHVA